MPSPSGSIRRVLPFVVVFAAASVAAQQQGSSVAASAPAVAAQPDPMICKKEAKTGSHYKRKVCRPASQWREMQEQSQEALRKLKSGPSIGQGEGQ